MSLSEFGEVYDDKRHLSGVIFDQTLSDIPQRELLTVESSATINAAVTAMNDKHNGYALVVKDGKLVGIVTERDILSKVAGGPKTPGDDPVESIMTANPDVLDAHASIAFALQRMSVKGYRHIPLVDSDRRPVGCVSVRDIVNWMVELIPAAVTNLPPASGKFPRHVDGG